VAIHCPYCRHEIELKGAHAGRFKPRCPQCNGKFALVIADGASPVVAALEDQKQETLAPSIESALGLDAPKARTNATVAPARTAQISRETMPPAASMPASANVTTPPPASPAVTQRITTPPPAAASEADRALSPSNVDAPANSADNGDLKLAGALGGYEIIHKLGQGGMGAVYLARQVSLDREVAVKVLHPKFAKDPDFVARFTREAYAAAHLVHHNVVAIHDIGAQDDIHYYSMEFVHGQSLGEVVSHEGKLDPEAAVGYVLQAARGLKFAHDHGMIHRDIKPDNLLLNDQGIVKVADLGLVKTPGSTETVVKNPEGDDKKKAHHATSANITQANLAMGTPAFMAPEQAQDASKVDGRADIYSLGCTLYDLVTGKPPFQGRTAMEVMTKHAREALVPPDRVVKHVPATLSAIVVRMMGKKPDDRYKNMGDVVKALEEFLGVESSGPFSPKEEHVKALEASLDWFNGSSWASLRSKLILAFYAICIVLTGYLFWTKHPVWAGGIIGFAVLAFACYQVLIGVTQRTYVFLRFRQLMFSSSIKDWLTWAVGAFVALSLIYLFGWHWAWLGFCIAALGVAAGFHFLIDRAVSNQREKPIANTETMLKSMRLRGLDEEALRQFVCKYAGDRWEEFYEALFGYEAKIQARQKWGRGDRGSTRKKFGAWRDSLIAWIDAKMRARQEEKEKRLLQAVEVKSLEAKGVSMMDARRQAKRRAENIVEHAAHVKDTMAMRAMETAAPTKDAEVSMASFRAMLDSDAKSDEKPAPRRKGNYVTRRFGGPLDWIFGQPMRLALAFVLLAAFGVWRHQRGDTQRFVETAKDLQGSRVDPTEAVKRDPSKAIDTEKDFEAVDIQKRDSLRIPLVPQPVLDALSSKNTGVAGLILLVSSLFRGNMLGLITYFACAVALIGPAREFPIVGALNEHVAMLASAVVGLLGLIFFRAK
jgi:serine/threonine protein kinase